MSQASNNNISDILSNLSDLPIPNSTVDEKTRAEILSNVENALSNLSENHSGASTHDQLLRSVWKDVRSPSAWKRMRSPEDEDRKSSRYDDYRDSLASDTFKKEMEKKTAKHVSIDTCKNPSTGMYDTDVYIGSVFATGDKDPKRWLDELARSVVVNETLRRTRTAAMGLPTCSSPSLLAKHTISEIINSKLLPASKTSEGGEPSGYDTYLQSFQSHDRQGIESFYEKVIPHEIYAKASYLTDPITKLRLSFGPYAGMNQKDWKLSGTILASSHPNGQVTNDSIIRSIESNKVTLEELAASYKKATGKELPSLSKPDERLFNAAPGCYGFGPSQEMVSKIISSYLTNATSPNKKRWEDVDLTEALSIPSSKPYSKGLYAYYSALDDMIGNATHKAFGTELSPFRDLGMIHDERETDLRNVRFHLVEESDLDGPVTIKSFWPKDEEEVLRSLGHSNASEGNNEFETAAALLYI